MYKTVFIIFIMCFAIFVSKVNAQSTINNRPDSFFSVTRGKEWIISKVYITSSQTDKKSYFNNCTFKFNEADTSNFLIQIAGKNSIVGHWTPHDKSKILFSIPLIMSDTSAISASDSLYNQGIKILCAWPLQETEMQPALLKFTIADPMRGEILIEMKKRELF